MQSTAYLDYGLQVLLKALFSAGISHTLCNLNASYLARNVDIASQKKEYKRTEIDPLL